MIRKLIGFCLLSNFNQNKPGKLSAFKREPRTTMLLICYAMLCHAMQCYNIQRISMVWQKISNLTLSHKNYNLKIGTDRSHCTLKTKSDKSHFTLKNNFTKLFNCNTKVRKKPSLEAWAELCSCLIICVMTKVYSRYSS